MDTSSQHLEIRKVNWPTDQVVRRAIATSYNCPDSPLVLWPDVMERRSVELELFPALRNCNMSFYAYNPVRDILFFCACVMRWILTIIHIRSSPGAS